jgi:hypothetical protein
MPASRSPRYWIWVIAASCIDGSKTSKRPLPRLLARYIATSALRTRSSAVLSSALATATPMLAWATRLFPPTSNGSLSNARTRCATRMGTCLSAQAGSTMTN